MILYTDGIKYVRVYSLQELVETNTHHCHEQPILIKKEKEMIIQREQNEKDSKQNKLFCERKRFDVEDDKRLDSQY